MGWASYDTKLGPAGYAHADVCHFDDCDEEIDRGLSFLCGSRPGDETAEFGCGRWFCAKHLFYPPRDTGIDPFVQGLCGRCLTEFESEDDDE